MRSRPKAAITTTVRSRPEQAQQERGFAARRSASRATAKRCEPTERLGSPWDRQRHHERVLLIGRRAMRTSIRASGTFDFPRQQAEDMTAPEAFAKPQPNP